MKKRIEKLLTVKSLVTLILTVLFCVLACKNVITGEQVNSVFLMVISFYFGTQYKENEVLHKEDNH